MSTSDTDLRSPRAGTGRIGWILAGHALVGLAFVGAILPLLPSAVFVLLAASCYMRGSERFYRWLLRHRVFGSIIRDWRETRSMSRAAKRSAIATVVVSLSLSIALVSSFVVRALLFATMVGLVTMFLRIKTTVASSPVGAAESIR